MKGEPGEGEVLLLRFPDTSRGRLRVLHRLKSESPSVIEIISVIDRKDVLVTFVGGRSTPATLYRVVGKRLVNIAETSVYGDLRPVDLDRDGVPELISTGCCDWTPWGRAGMFGVAKYDGTRFVDDGRAYVDHTMARSGAPPEERPFLAPYSEGDPRRHYMIHVYNAGATSVRVQFDGRDVIPKKVLRHQHIRRSLEVASAADRHRLAVTAEGPPGSAVHVLVEELRSPLSSPPTSATAARPR